MRHFLARLAAVALTLSIASCGGDGADITWLRVMHAIPDGPLVRVGFDDYVFRRDLDFGNTTDEGGESLLSRTGPTAKMRAAYFAPVTQSPTAFLELDVPVQKDAISTVILAGSFDAPRTITIVAPRRPRPLAALYFQFAHATPALGALDIYVTAPDTELAATAPFATVEPLGNTGSLEVPFGATRIRLAPAGTLDVVMDTGTLDFAAQTGAVGPGAEWLFAITPSVLAGPAPVYLVGSSGRSALTITDEDTPATLRAFHALQGAPAVDVVVATEPGTLLLSGLGYGTRSPLLAAPAGTFPLEFRDAGSAAVLASQPLPFTVGIEYATFLVAPLATPAVLAVQSRTRSVANQSRLRFAHLAEGGEFFIAYLSASEADATAPENRVLVDLRFGQVTDHVARLPGDYYITLTRRFYATPEGAATAPETVVYGPVPLELAGGDVLTYAIFPAPAEGEAELVRQFDDRMP
jgi:hypothetical protein